jgi:mannosyl-3-phosphoglycerate phosphatase family protein
MSATESTLVIFTDLDGSLLGHHDYDLGPAAAVVERLVRDDVPLVLVSSKTRAEIGRLRRRLGLAHPYVCENGGAVVLPPRYFPFDLEGARATADGDLVVCGPSRDEVVTTLRAVALRLGIAVRGFHEMSDEELARDSGLSLADAILARRREFGEAVRVLDEAPGSVERLSAGLAAEGLQCTQGGRYLHVTGAGVDKGTAVRTLARWYGRRRAGLTTVGLGDSPNDIPMLESVDVAVIIRNDAAPGAAAMRRALPRAVVTDREGPAGWADAVSMLLDSSGR